MTEQQVRQIIQDELKNLLTINGFVFDQNMKILDARNIQLGRTNGTQIGTEPTQKLAFLGATPVTRQNAISFPSGGGTIDSAARTAVIAVIEVLKNVGLTA